MTNSLSDARFASALSTLSQGDRAIEEVCTKALQELGGKPSLAVVFLSLDHSHLFDSAAEQICERLGTENLIGCSGESIVGTGREVEGQPAVSLWLASTSGAMIRVARLTFENTPDGGSFFGWPDDLPDTWTSEMGLIALAEPFTFPADFFLQRMNEDQPETPIVGGMASGASQPGENRIWIGKDSYQDGAAIAIFQGELRMRTIVSQGCRPIGQHFVITKCDKNVILELGGKPALQQLQELFQTLPVREQKAVQSGLHVGRVVTEYQDQFEQGDFLVRNVLGFGKEHGAIAIGDFVRVGQTIQFHIRDAETADAELRQLLARSRREQASRAALLFTCNGRGTRLFDEPHHDAGAVRDALGDIPVAGFFAAGELGPIGRKNFMHGFTASIALFD